MNQNNNRITSQDAMYHTPAADTQNTRRGFMGMAAAVGAGALGVSFFGRRQQAAAEEAAHGRLDDVVDTSAFEYHTPESAFAALEDLILHRMPVPFIRDDGDFETLEWHIAEEYIVDAGPLNPLAAAGITPAVRETAAAKAVAQCGYTYSGWYCMNARWGIGVCYNRYRYRYYCGQYNATEYGFSTWCPWRCY